MANNDHCNRCDNRKAPLVDGNGYYDFLCKPCLARVTQSHKSTIGRKSSGAPLLAQLLNGRK